MVNGITPNIMVDSVYESTKFYKEHLGLNVIMSVPETGTNLDWAMVGNEHTIIMFQQKQSIIDEYPTLKTDTINYHFTLYLKNDNLKEKYDELKDKVSIIKELHQTPYGATEFAFLDNNNIIITMAE